jgi:predicted ArsR family transcriptional regulator
MDTFEIPVNSNIYNTHRLLTNISDDFSLETEEEFEQEEEDEDDPLSTLSEQEKDLYNELMQINPDSAEIIRRTREDDFITSAGNIPPDNVSKKLGISKDQAKRSLQLLIDSGYLIKSGKYYKLNENFRTEVDPEAEFKRRRAEIEKITDPEKRKVAEIEFIMSNLMSGVGEAAANKIREYADRIISGKETRDRIIQGLPPSFVTGIDQLLEAQGYTTTEQEEVKSDLNIIKEKLLTLESDAFLSGSVAGEIDEKEFEVLIDKLINNTNDDNLREQVVDLLLQYYQEGKYTEIVNELLNDTKLGKLTESIIEDPDLIRKKLIGCPKI